MPELASPKTYSSESHAWKTDPIIPAGVLEVIGKPAFDLDPACTDQNIPALKYYTDVLNGLMQPWDGHVFLNPPYGHQFKTWVQKAANSISPTCSVWALLPFGGREGQRYFHTWVWRIAQFIHIFEGPVYFYRDGVKGKDAPFSVMLAYYGTPENANRDLKRWHKVKPFPGTLITKIGKGDR